jgi:hypothetical protein
MFHCLALGLDVMLTPIPVFNAIAAIEAFDFCNQLGFAVRSKLVQSDKRSASYLFCDVIRDLHLLAFFAKAKRPLG